ncbi:MAG: 50S ribosomal protein L4 [Candidatus Woesearchaeota archaeon]
MKLIIFDQEKKETGKIDLPIQFSEEIRPDLIKRAVLTLNANNRQPYSPDPRAGKKASALVSKRRRNYRGSYGKGISRVPRKILTRRGSQMNWVGAFAPQTRGGRRAHPPNIEKIWEKKINKKENRKAICSAIAGSINIDYIKARNHIIPKEFPFIIDNSFEEINKTKDLLKALKSLGFQEELKRVSEIKIRAGRGKMRGRKYITKKGPLIVVSKKCPLLKFGNNIPGVDIVKINELNAALLAPAAQPGRLTLYTKGAIEILNNGLFQTTQNKNT